MIHLLFLTGGMGSSSADPESQTDYYRRYLDDPKVLVAVGSLPAESTESPTTDLSYYRRHLDDF